MLRRIALRLGRTKPRITIPSTIKSPNHLPLASFASTSARAEIGQFLDGHESRPLPTRQSDYAKREHLTPPSRQSWKGRAESSQSRGGSSRADASGGRARQPRFGLRSDNNNSGEGRGDRGDWGHGADVYGGDHRGVSSRPRQPRFESRAPEDKQPAPAPEEWRLPELPPITPEYPSGPSGSRSRLDFNRSMDPSPQPLEEIIPDRILPTPSEPPQEAQGEESLTSPATQKPRKVGPKGFEAQIEEDEFFSAHAELIPRLPQSAEAVKRAKEPVAKHFAPFPLASYTPPKESGVAMVKRFMLKHRFLTNPQIWKMGTGHLKPPVTPAYVFNPDGTIRMKRVATLREGRRPWVPPHQASFPGHPFRSVRFMKETLLASLEDAGLIHKTNLYMPLETEEDHAEAIRLAESLNRKAERRAAWEGKPPPAVVAPATAKLVWGWMLGPPFYRPPSEGASRPSEKEPEADDSLPEEENTVKAAAEYAGYGVSAAVRNEMQYEKDQQALSNRFKAGNAVPYRQHDDQGKLYPTIAAKDPGPRTLDEVRAREDWHVDHEKWAWAERQEYEYHKTQLMVAQETAERQYVRRTRYREEREEFKRQREEDRKSGRTRELRKEQRRLEALQHIEQYAKETGQDVSDWFEEIGSGPLDKVTPYQPTHQSRGGAIPRKPTNPRSKFRPVGFPIN